MSRRRDAGERPTSLSTERTRSTNSGCSSWRVETLTVTPTSRPWRCHPFGLGAGLLRTHVADGEDRSGLLGERHAMGWRGRSPRRMAPRRTRASQRLGRHLGQRHDRLVVDGELSGVDTLGAARARRATAARPRGALAPRQRLDAWPGAKLLGARCIAMSASRISPGAPGSRVIARPTLTAHLGFLRSMASAGRSAFSRATRRPSRQRVPGESASSIRTVNPSGPGGRWHQQLREDVAESADRSPQELIPDVVAVTVVDRLGMVEVDERPPDQGQIKIEPSERVRDAHTPGRAIWQTRVEAPVGDAFFEELQSAVTSRAVARTSGPRTYARSSWGAR